MRKIKISNKIKNLHWYFIGRDINRKEIIHQDLFDSISFCEDVSEIIRNKGLTRKEFKAKVRSALLYTFWSRCEYEVIVSDLFDKDETKIDAFWQVEPNLDVLVDYIINNTNYSCA